jgi:cardiolipin synthase
VTTAAATWVPPWLPNAVSVVRISLVPIWLWVAEDHRDLILAGAGDHTTALVVILLLLGFSDLLDGWLARRYGLTTALGSVLDAVADKLAQVVIVGFYTFRLPTAAIALPAWFFVVVFGRDLLMALGWWVVRLKRGKAEPKHQVHGKLSSLLLFTLVLLLTLGELRWAIRGLLFLLTGLIVFSTALYAQEGWRQLRGPSPPRG